MMKRTSLSLSSALSQLTSAFTCGLTVALGVVSLQSGGANVKAEVNYSLTPDEIANLPDLEANLDFDEDGLNRVEEATNGPTGTNPWGFWSFDEIVIPDEFPGENSSSPFTTTLVAVNGHGDCLFNVSASSSKKAAYIYQRSTDDWIAVVAERDPGDSSDTYFVAEDFNDHLQVVGYGRFAGPTSVGVIWSPQLSIDLLGPSDAAPRNAQPFRLPDTSKTPAFPLRINNLGDTVGNSPFPFAIDQGVLLDPDDVYRNLSASEFEQGILAWEDINDLGEFAGTHRWYSYYRELILHNADWTFKTGLHTDNFGGEFDRFAFLNDWGELAGTKIDLSIPSPFEHNEAFFQSGNLYRFGRVPTYVGGSVTAA